MSNGTPLETIIFTDFELTTPRYVLTIRYVDEVWNLKSQALQSDSETSRQKLFNVFDGRTQHYRLRCLLVNTAAATTTIITTTTIVNNNNNNCKTNNN
uniref:Uncharacterized protein n=1 Tax=Glossina pallidipes TaxID=7398 RepID=A0A1B0A8E7_GLOPL